MIRQPAFGGKRRGAATASPKPLPAPTGGWNTRDNEANMPPTKATALDNFYPRAADVVLRKGCVEWATDLPGVARSLITYNGLSDSKFFATTDFGIFDITAEGPVGAAVVALNDGRVSATMMTNIAGNFLITANGTDSMWRFDGTTWTELDTEITGVVTSDVNFVHVFKNRLWMLEQNSMSAYYLGVNQIQGAAVEFPIGQIFNKGGKLVAIGSWTIDGGEGVDDHIVFVTDQGELAVYKGTDPANSDKWELAGVFYLGEPLGRKCLVTFGGDLVYLCQNGLFPLSKALLSTSINYRSALSDEIGPTFAQYSSQYFNLEGWQPFVFPKESLLLVNVPVAENIRTDQLVMNSVSKAWCRFLNWQAVAWGLFGKDAFFSSRTSVFKAFTGTSDNGANIEAYAKQAYVYFGGGRATTHIKEVRPNLKYDVTPQLQLAVSTDFAIDVTWSSPDLPANQGGIWDQSNWDETTWAYDLQTVRRWQAVYADEGYCSAILLRIISNKSTVVWNATDVLYVGGGML